MRYLLIALLLFLGCEEDPVSFESIYGCTNQSACNFNPNATIFDDTCIYEVDCSGVCGGDAMEPLKQLRGFLLYYYYEIYM